jgi:hypothetical protein
VERVAAEYNYDLVAYGSTSGYNHMIREEGISLQANPEKGKLNELPHDRLIVAFGNSKFIWPTIKKF